MNSRQGNQAQSLRNMNMGAFGAQPNSRQTPRLQNTQKTGLGNGNAGANWAFGAPSSAGAFANAAGAPGLSGRPGQLSGFAQVMGGGGGQAPLDINNFPALAGPGAPRTGAQPSWDSNIIRNQSTQPTQQQSQPPSQQQLPNRTPSAAPSQHSTDHLDSSRSQPQSASNGPREEFTPLSGQASLNGDSLQHQNGFNSADPSSPSERFLSQNGQPTDLSDPLSNLAINPQAPIGTGGPMPQSQSQAPPVQQPQNGQSNQAPSSSLRWADMTEGQKWGMAGLGALFEARRQYETGGVMDDTLPPIYKNTCMLMGHDLNSLGLDLDSSEPIHPTFSVFPAQHASNSYFDYHDRFVVPAFAVPPAYIVNNVPEMATRMPAFSDETLFCIFYQYPRDIRQEMAASELTNREWRYHKVLRKWLQKDSRDANQSHIELVDLTGGVPVQEPVRINASSERGVYLFFEVMNWQRHRRELTLNYDELDGRIIPTLTQLTATHIQQQQATAGTFQGMGGPVGGHGGVERQNSVISGNT